MGSIPIFGTIFGEVAKWSNAADCKSVPSGSMVQTHLSPPLYDMMLPRSQVVRHHTLTVVCASPNLAEAAINICPVSSAGRAFDF